LGADVTVRVGSKVNWTVCVELWGADVTVRVGSKVNGGACVLFLRACVVNWIIDVEL